MAVIMSLNMVYWAFKGIFHCLLIGIKNSEIPRNTFVVEAFSSSKLENLRSLNIQFGPFFLLFLVSTVNRIFGGLESVSKSIFGLTNVDYQPFLKSRNIFLFLFQPHLGSILPFLVPSGFFWVVLG